MPDYKRKKFRRFFGHKKNRIKREKRVENTRRTENTTGVVPEKEIKVVRGTKFKRIRRIKIISAILAVICTACIILSIVLPVGLYENLVNFFALIGPGSYPISVSGSSVMNTLSGGGYYFVLTDTNISAYSNAGKIVFDELHGFANPVITISDTRALIYDQGGTTVYIYNLGGKLHTIETDYEIITASISRDADFAVATHSDRYASVTTVYDKNAKKLFTWNSAKDMITNILVDTKGKKLAVTTLNADSGQFDTKLSVFEIKSGNTVYSTNLEGSIPLSLVNTGSGFSLICNDKYRFCDWASSSSNEVTTSGEINMFRNSKNGLLLVFNRANDRSDNTVILISKKGKKLSEFKINATITDIQYKDNRIYTVSDTTATVYAENGKILMSKDCGYGVVKLAVISSNAIAAVTDDEIIKIKF